MRRSAEAQVSRIHVEERRRFSQGALFSPLALPSHRVHIVDAPPPTFYANTRPDLGGMDSLRSQQAGEKASLTDKRAGACGEETRVDARRRPDSLEGSRRILLHISPGEPF